MTIQTIHISNLLVCRARFAAVTRVLDSGRLCGSRPGGPPRPCARRHRDVQFAGFKRGTLAALLFGALLCAGAAHAAPAGAASAATTSISLHVGLSPLTPLLAVGAAEPDIELIFGFLSKILMLVGIVMIFYGGWKTHRGETSDGILAIIGGFIVSMAIPIIRYFFSLFS